MIKFKKAHFLTNGIKHLLKAEISVKVINFIIGISFTQMSIIFCLVLVFSNNCNAQIFVYQFNKKNTWFKKKPNIAQI